MNRLAGIKGDGKHFLMLILEPANINRLTQLDQPVRIHVEDMFPDGIPAQLELMLAYSATPMADASKFVKMSDMSFDERTPVMKAKKPHCPECRSTLEQIGNYSDSTFPVRIVFCPVCGCTLGISVDPAKVTPEMKINKRII